MVSSLNSTLNNGRNNNRELKDFVSLVTAGSSGFFALNGVQVEVHLNYYSIHTSFPHIQIIITGIALSKFQTRTVNRYFK